MKATTTRQGRGETGDDFEDYGADTWSEYLRELDASDESPAFSPLLTPGTDVE